jgi:hypothetical protein
VQNGTGWEAAESGVHSGVGAGVEGIEEDGIKVTRIIR